MVTHAELNASSHADGDALDASASSPAPALADAVGAAEESESSNGLSEARLKANRANARKSTGPRTEEGKRRSSQNALVHGLRSASILGPGEDRRELLEYRMAIIRTLNPRNPVEMELVEQVIRAGWKLRRYQAAEVEALESRHAGDWTSPLGRALCGFSVFEPLPRYEQQYARMMSRALDQLRKLKNDPVYGTLCDFAGEMVEQEKEQREELESSPAPIQSPPPPPSPARCSPPSQNAPNEPKPAAAAVSGASSVPYNADATLPNRVLSVEEALKMMEARGMYVPEHSVPRPPPAAEPKNAA